MLRWSNGIARHESNVCTSSNAASASRFGPWRGGWFFSFLVEQICLSARKRHLREPRRPKQASYTRIRRQRRPGNFWRFFCDFRGQIRFRTRMARTPVGGPDKNDQKADFQYPASVCIVRGPLSPFFQMAGTRQRLSAESRTGSKNAPRLGWLDFRRLPI